MLKFCITLQALAIAAGLTVAADLAAHKRTELVGGVNVWGYRGAVAPQRHPDELRILVVGGTRAFGWGGAAENSVPATLYWAVSRSAGQSMLASRQVVSINLGAMGRTAADYAAVLEHYAYLMPDYICIYDDLGRDQTPVPRSRLFRRFGYALALPLVVREKGMALSYGSVEGGYTGVVTGQPSFIHRQSGALLQAIGQTLQTLDGLPAERAGGADAEAMIAAITAARRTAKSVVVAVGPAESDREREDLATLASRMNAAIPHDPHVSLLDLSGVAGLTGPGLTLDGYNYNAVGRERVAVAISRELIAHIQRDLAP
ncbi:MAG: hypothetical protein ABI665_06890 [Vicinamibacterales bacterium]